MTKKMWDNSNMQEDIEWGNIPVGNMSDEELYKKNWNRVEGSKNMWLNMSDEKKTQRANSISEKKKINHPTKGKQLSADWKKNVSDSLKGHTKSNTTNMNKIKKKPLMSEDGPFASVADAQQHFGYKWEGNVRHKIKKSHPGWYWLTQEEYIRLTKK